MQTRDGYIWLNTLEGLVRYDGAQFTVFNRDNTPALKSTDVRALYADREGNLWISIFDHGLLRYRDGNFSSYSISDGLSSNLITAIFQDRSGRLWLGTNAGLNEFRNGEFISYRKADGLSDDNVTSIAQDKGGDLWVGTYHGLNRLPEGAFHRETIEKFFPQTAITVVYTGREAIWVGTHSGFYRYDGGKFTRYGRERGLPHTQVTAVLQDNTGTLWIGTNGAGICRLIAPASRDSRFECYTARNGLTNNLILSLLEDREGSLWIGTYSGGLNRFRDGAVVTYGKNVGLNGTIWSIYEGRNRDLWIATDAGLRRMHDGKITRYMAPGGTTRNQAKTVTEDRSGNVWVGTFGAGLNKFSEKGFKNSETANWLRHDIVLAVYQDHEGSIWVGTVVSGLGRLSHGNWKVFGEKDGLRGGQFWSILEDHQNRLWVGGSGGLFCLEKKRFTSLALGDDHTAVMSLHEDGDHALWIATFSKGLLRYQDGKLVAFTKKQGLFSDSMWSILEDDQGNLWMSSDFGIFRVKKSELNDLAEGRIAAIHSVAYGRAEGMPGIECNGGGLNAAWKTKDGRLLFACNQGLVAIAPRPLAHNSIQPPVVIEQVLINHNQAAGENLSVPARPGSLEFHFAALSFLVPEKIVFKYKLEPYEKDWVDVGSRRVAFYTNIPPGNYRFRVIAANNDGVWNPQGASFAFRLEPGFYQTQWFLAIMGGLALGVVYSLHRWRLAVSGARSRQQIETEQLRSQLALAQLDALRMQMNPHFLFNTLNAVSSLMRFDVDRADTMLDKLGHLLRSSFAKKDKLKVTLEEELAFINTYLDIQQIKLGSQLVKAVTIEPNLCNALIPDMILQPLVENAIVHGVSRCRPCGRLKIEISSLEHRLLIRIYNDVAPCSGAPETNGIGLRNTRERLEILYPESHSMEIVEDKRGVTVLLELPLQFAAERCS